MEQTQLAKVQETIIDGVPPRMHIPQIPPRQVVQNRLVYVGPTLQQQQSPISSSSRSEQYPSSLLHLPPRYIQNRFEYVAPTYTKRPTIQISPAGFVTILRMSPSSGEMKVTPLLPQGVINYAPTTASTPFQANNKWRDMEVKETLFGCGTLIVIAIVLLVVLYYLAT